MRKKVIVALILFAGGLLIFGALNMQHRLEKGWQAEDKGNIEAAMKFYALACGEDRSSRYREIAARELVFLEKSTGRPEPLEYLTKRLSRRGRLYDLSYAEARATAGWALGELRDPRGVGPLLDSLEEYRSSYPTNTIFAKLDSVRKWRNLNAFVDNFVPADAKDKSEMRSALRQKVIDRHERWKAAISEILKGKDFYEEKDLEKILEFFRSVGDNESIGVKLAERFADAASNLLQNKKTSGPRETISVVRALGQIGDARAIKPLTELLGETYLAREVCIALARIGNVSAIEPIKKAIEHTKDPELRLYMTYALALSGEAHYDEEFRRTLRPRSEAAPSEPAPNNRLALKILIEYPREEYLPEIVKLLQGDDPLVIQPATEVVRMIGLTRSDPSIEKALLAMLEERWPSSVRMEALRALGALKLSGSMGAVREILDDEKEEMTMRLLAASVLLQAGDNAGEDLIRRVLRWRLDTSSGGPYSEREVLEAAQAAALARDRFRELLEELYANRKVPFYVRSIARDALKRGTAQGT